MSFDNENSGHHDRQRIVNHYAIDDQNDQFLTLLYPHDKTHPKAKLNAIDKKSYNGIQVTHPKATDFILKSQGKVEQKHLGHRFQAQLIVLRNSSHQLSEYFAYEAKKYWNEEQQLGFSSDHSIKIHWTENQVTVGSAGGELTLYQKGIQKILQEGKELKVRQKNKGSLSVILPQGTHQLKLQ